MLREKSFSRVTSSYAQATAQAVCFNKNHINCAIFYDISFLIPCRKYQKNNKASNQKPISANVPRIKG